MNRKRRAVRSLAISIAGAAALAANAASASAQAYAARPISVIVPFPAGSPSDLVTRIVTERMRAFLGQPIVIDNVVGGSGSIGAGRVARAAPDGYTLGLGNTATHVINGAALALKYDVVKDFEPLGLLVNQPQIIVAKKAMPAEDLKEFIAWLKANPGKATQGTSGPGSLIHLAGVLFQKKTGAHIQLVPYRGASQTVQDLVSGQIDMMIDPAANSLPHVRAGSIKAYAVTANRRLVAAPDIPTVDEAGLPGFYVSSWQALWAPRGLPKPIVDKLSAAVMDALADSATRQRIAELGPELFARRQQTPGALAAYQRAEIEKWWPIIKEAGIGAK